MKWILAVPRALIGAMIRFPRITVAAALFLLICLIWVAGPLIGMEQSDTRLLVIGGVILIWSLFLAFDRYRAERGAKLLEASLRNQAKEQVVQSRPDRKEEIDALRQQFEKAVSSLKQSKLGKRYRGTTALYALPWYMFIGPPASGKSTALLHSGLQFPSLGGSGRGIQGVGGTRNCDWWFTSEAVLLDTAGRYVTEDDDREEWFGFLGLLKKFRKEKPINGVLVAISLPELLQGSDEELEWHAKTIRARVDELIERLGILFPVYLVFTKCDLLRGFVEFFEDFGKAERDQIWGATFSRNPAANPAPRQLFETEFQQLLGALGSRRVARLASARGSQKIRDVYGFPLQVLSGREKLAQFVELLFQQNPYHENPIFRGFYFTSGTQEGTPIDRILGAVGRASGLSEAISGSFDAQKEGKSYFIKNLFTDVIFPDQVLAGHSSVMARQRGYARVAVFVGSVLVTITLLVGSVFSFLGNRLLLGSIKSSSMKTLQMSVREDRQFAKNVDLLDRLRAGLDQLIFYREKGLPLRLRGGLYRGSTLYLPMRALYFQRFSDLLLVPTQATLEATLQQFAARGSGSPQGQQNDAYYSLLKTYLMLSDRGHRNLAFLDLQMKKLWTELLRAQYGERIPDGLSETIDRQLIFYTHYPDPEGLPYPVTSPALVQEVRRVLRESPLPERLFGRARRAAMEGTKVNPPSEPFTLKKALGAKASDVLMDDYQIPGMFSGDEGRASFRSALDRVLEETRQESWVLDESGGTPEQWAGEVEKLYFTEYIRHWRMFLESLRMRSAANLQEAERLFSELDLEDSPLVEVLAAVDRNTNLGKQIAPPVSVSSSMIEKVKKGLGLGGPEEAPAARLTPSPVALRFLGLHEFVVSIDPKREPPAAQYLNELRRGHEAIRAMTQPDAGGQGAITLARTIATGGSNDLVLAQRNADRILQGMDPEFRRILAPLLLQPFRLAASGVMGNAFSDLNRRWRDEVYEVWRQSIAGRYPFNKGGEDVALADLAGFFHPESGTLWKFYEKEIKPYVEEGKDRWEVKRQIGSSLPISPELLESLRQARVISESLFPRGNADLKLSFDLYPYPTPGVTESIVTVDGKPLRYRNEPQEWHQFDWPLSASGTPGASLQVHSGNPLPAQQFSGRWGFFRLLDSGRILPVSNTVYRVEWEFKDPNAKVLKIRYDLRAQSYRNPFKPGLLSDFRIPNRIG